MWRGPRITPCPRNTATAEAHDQCPVMEWSGRAAAPPEREAGNGLAIEGAQPCPTNQSRPLPPWASILARIRSTSSALIDAARSCCGRSGHAGQVEARIANMPPCLVGMEACVGAHHLSRKLHAHGHDARLMPARYVRAYLKGQKNDFRDGEAIAEAVQRPTMKFVATKTAEQLDLQALHRVRARLVSQRTGIVNQIRAFLLDRGVAVRKGPRFLRTELPRILATRYDVLSPRMVHVIEELAGDWHRLDERIKSVSSEIEALADQDPSCERLMTVPGIGPIISSATVAAIGNGAAFSKGRDFGAWLGLVPRQISTGDRTILGAISRRGNRYLRALFVQAAWVVLI